MFRLRLYTRPDCHLCDVAESIIRDSCAGAKLQTINIEDDLGLLRKYGIPIPVLQRMDTGSELCWPFDEAELIDFLRLAA